jgi:hypothetical protein
MSRQSKYATSPTLLTMLLLLFRCFCRLCRLCRCGHLIVIRLVFSIFGDGHVPTTRTAERCIHLGTFSGACGQDDDHSYYDDGHGNGIGTEYYGITTMRRLRKGVTINNLSKFYTSIQEYIALLDENR